MTQQLKLLHFPEKLPLPALWPLSPCPTGRWDTNRTSKAWDNPTGCPTSISPPSWGLIPIPLPHHFQAIPCFSVPLPALSDSGMLQERQQSGQGKAGAAVPLLSVPQFP